MKLRPSDGPGEYNDASYSRRTALKQSILFALGAVAFAASLTMYSKRKNAIEYKDGLTEEECAKEYGLVMDVNHRYLQWTDSKGNARSLTASPPDSTIEVKRFTPEDIVLILTLYDKTGTPTHTSIERVPKKTPITFSPPPRGVALRAPLA